MENLIFLDLETSAGPNKPSLEDVKVPANYKDPVKIKEYQIANQEEQWKSQALNSMKGEILCIGFAMLDTAPIITYESTEMDTMKAFEDAIRAIRGTYREPLKWCGWNILSFDLPWLWRKAIKYDLRYLRDSILRDNRNMTLDLMKVWAADFKDYVSLASCAEYLGIEHEGGNGATIHDLWVNGDAESISAHCRRDIETVSEIHKRLLL